LSFSKSFFFFPLLHLDLALGDDEWRLFTTWWRRNLLDYARAEKGDPVTSNNRHMKAVVLNGG
jgi:hypothetical protein